MTSASFYHAFEAAFRGNRDEITQRLRVYVPFIEPFLRKSRNKKVADLGCGRGEWLELMKSIGMSAYGVDLDEGMLKDCFDRDLAAEKNNAITWLLNQQDETCAVISGFHIAEHLEFSDLQKLISEALRVLQPGGLLILETPNAENINVGTLSFHMDPTHVRPLPPGLLSFLPRHYGFHRVKVLRLQENESLLNAHEVNLIDIINGVSPDYSIIAQKNGDEDLLKEFDAQFSKDYGLTLETLIHKYENKLRSENDRIQNDLNLLRNEMVSIEELYNSTSWKITRPLRILSEYLKNKRVYLPEKIKVTKLYAANLLRYMMRYVVARPALRQCGIIFINKFPGLKRKLRRLFFSGHLQGGLNNSLEHHFDEDDLSPKMKSIFHKLQSK